MLNSDSNLILNCLSRLINNDLSKGFSIINWGSKQLKLIPNYVILITTAGRAAPGGAKVGSGVDGGTGGGPGPAGTSNAAGGKDRGLAHGSAIHSKWHRAGGPGVV